MGRVTTERSLVLVKPDGFARGLTGEVIRRIERKGYRLVALRILTPTREMLGRHYAEHAEKPFFGELVDFMSSGPVTAIVIEGNQRVENETVISYMQLQPGDPFDPDRIDESIKALFQTGLFADVQIVAPDTYEISVRLRGQLGTDGVMPEVWPAGSTIVLLDLALSQIDLAPSSRGLVRYYRIGAASRGYDDSNAVLRTEAFDGIGLRPYPVAHLRHSSISGDIQLVWRRRTRLDGDSWQSVEVPLSEESEAYLVRVIESAEIQAEYTTSQPAFTYTAAMRSSDGVSTDFQIAVAQLSASYGPGPFRQIEVQG